MNISVSEDMYSFIRERGQSYCYSSISEYIRSLVREDQFQDRKKTEPSPPPRRASECVDMVRNEMYGDNKDSQ